MNILSLFDGISVGYLALQRAGIEVNKYYASEIDKYAMQISERNYPDIIRLGDVQDWKRWDIDWSCIDLLIGGSPCQGFSFAGKQLNFEDERSKLFFEYVDILNHLRTVNPNIKFLLENVRMKKEYQDIITEHLGIKPVTIDSALVSAQRRKRLYWTNIADIKQPEDKGIMLKDIVHETADFVFECLGKYRVPFSKTLQIIEKEVGKSKVGYFRSDSQGNRVHHINDKSVTLVGNAGGLGAKTGLYLFGCITPDRIEKRQIGQRFNDGQKFYTLTATDKHGVLVEGYIRKLTPVECERLQTLPDNYTEGVSDNQRYKMLGNAWTADVIAYIFKHLQRKE
nr:MAG TPA: Cytosine specific methyltransferase [Caudoviricetes sp.]